MHNKDACSPSSKSGYGVNTAGHMQSNAGMFTSLHSALTNELPSSLAGNSNNGGGFSLYPYSNVGTDSVGRLFTSSAGHLFSSTVHPLSSSAADPLSSSAAGQSLFSRQKLPSRRASQKTLTQNHQLTDGNNRGSSSMIPTSSAEYQIMEDNEEEEEEEEDDDESPVEFESRTGQNWSQKETDILMRLRGQGKSFEDIRRHPRMRGRKVGAIADKYRKITKETNQAKNDLEAIAAEGKKEEKFIATAKESEEAPPRQGESQKIQKMQKVIKKAVLDHDAKMIQHVKAESRKLEKNLIDQMMEMMQ